MTTEVPVDTFGKNSTPECIRIATVGNVDSGKSTLVGVLTRSVLDDGRGKARQSVFSHKHERESGRTSSVSTEMMGFTGDSVLPPPSERVSRPELFMNVSKNCWRTITFLDLCGHEVYLKTTVFGLTAMMPDYAFVMVGANMGMQRMTREHIGLCTALQIPFVIIVTKIDIAPENVLEETKRRIAKVLRQARKQAIHVTDEASAARAAEELPHGKTAPVFFISSTTGEGLPFLRHLLRTVPLRTSCGKLSASLPVQFANRNQSEQQDQREQTPHSASTATATTTDVSETIEQNDVTMAEDDMHSTPPAPGTPQMEGQNGNPPSFSLQSGPPSALAPAKTSASLVHTDPGEVSIDSVFSIEGIGIVVAGMVRRGVIPVGANMLLGPDKSGEFHSVTVRSIEVNYVGQPVAREGYSAAFAIRQKNTRGRVTGRDGRKKQWIRRGMSLVAPQLNPVPHWVFEAEVIVLHHQTTIMQGYVPVVHVGVVTQSALIEGIRNTEGEEINTIRTGDRAIIRFRFCYQAEYIHIGGPVLFREGRCKGVGRILRLSDPGGTAGQRNSASGTTANAAGSAGRTGRRHSLLRGANEVSSVAAGP